MSKGIQIIKENNNLAEWSRQVEECRNSGLSVRSWCERNQIAVSANSKLIILSDKSRTVAPFG